MSEVLLEVKDLCKFFPAGKKKVLKAVDHVSFTINRGETLGLVGESGCVRDHGYKAPRNTSRNYYTRA